MNKRTTHFGYEEVLWQDKEERVGEVFTSVAKRYDIMNDLMSFGIHRLWKHFAISTSHIRAGDRVLDLAGGSGDLALKLCERVGDEGHVVLGDINAAMLGEGRDRLLNAGFIHNTTPIQCNAEALPFPDDDFDNIIIGFGLRNVTDKDQALREMFRVLKPGGQVHILEFSKPTSKLVESIYDVYSFSILPKLGEAVASDGDSYQYLAESIRMHPDQQTLLDMMAKAGFEDNEYTNLTAGIVALHRGYKY